MPVVPVNYDGDCVTCYKAVFGIQEFGTYGKVLVSISRIGAGFYTQTTNRIRVISGTIGKFGYRVTFPLAIYRIKGVK